MIVATLSPALGPLLVAAVLLAVAGVAKLRRPAPTGLALARTGLPGSDPLVRLLGAVEVASAVAAAVVGGVAAVPVASLYVGFAAFTAVQVRRAAATGETADCGCFGEADAPVGWTHVGVNVALAAAAVGAAAVGADGVAGAVDSDTGATLAVVAVALVAVAGVRALLTDLPAVRALVGSPATDGERARSALARGDPGSS